MGLIYSISFTNHIMRYFLFLLILISGCSKTITEDNLSYPILQPKRADAEAGNWKLILLSSPNEIACPTPLNISSQEHQSQLAEIVELQKEISVEEKELINYWGAGAILRWNEIMRELVAKHNIPPYQNPDGTYPAPNPNNPLAYPTFPFSNPPYAARAYAYLSTAQYDALVVAYHYKKLFAKSFPHQLNSNIKPYFSNTSPSSYPSEDAVVAAASVEILSLLFPADKDYILQKAEEHKLARLVGGGNVRNDLEAGETIGKAVAAKFIARAKTDGAGTAGGNATVWNNLKQQAVNRGEIPWISQETPPRPPMLPLFGKVKPFLFTTSDIETSLRPQAPPSTNSEQFKTELEEVYQFSTNLTREQQAIALFWSDGVRTYTPPGHWNYIAANDFIAEGYSEVRWARNMALLNMALMDAAIVCWDAKNYYFNPRPMQMNNRIKTCVGLPNFPSYISGHSTFSGSASAVLGYLLPQYSQKYHNMATEASLSRLYGAIHYRSDCEIGLTTGYKVGNYAVIRGKSDGAE